MAQTMLACFMHRCEQNDISFVAPQLRDALRSSSIARVPSALPFNGPARGSVHGPVAFSSTPIRKHHHHHARNNYGNSAPKLLPPAPAPAYGQQGLVLFFNQP